MQLPEFTIPKRRPPNAWRPSQNDLKRIAMMAAQGVTRELIAAEFNVTPKTLREHEGAREAVTFGRTMHKQRHLGRLDQLAAQDHDRKVALSATTWALNALHGIRPDQTRPEDDDDARATEAAEASRWIHERIERMEAIAAKQVKGQPIDDAEITAEANPPKSTEIFENAPHSPNSAATEGEVHGGRA